MTKLILDKVPETPTSDPMYDLTLGGYYSSEDFSSDPATQKKIDEAIDIVLKLNQVLEENDLLY